MESLKVICFLIELETNITQASCITFHIFFMNEILHNRDFLSDLLIRIDSTKKKQEK